MADQTTGRGSGLGWPRPADAAPRPDGACDDDTAAGQQGRRSGLGWPRDETEDDSEDAGIAPGDAAPRDPGSSAWNVVAPRAGAPTAASLVDAHAGGEATQRSLPIEQQAAAAVRARRLLADPLPRPARTRVIVVANQKGGVGKTTTAVNVAAALAMHAARVLVVDMDPQGNASTALGLAHHADVVSTYDVLLDAVPLAKAVQPCPDVPGLVAAPSTIDLAGADLELAARDGRELLLRHALTDYLRDHDVDYVIVDCPPTLGLLTVNALAAGLEVLVPLQCEYYALEGLSQLLRTIDRVRSAVNGDLTVAHVLLTMYDARTRLAGEVAAEVRAYFGPRVLPTAVPRSVRLSEAPGFGQTVLTYAPGSPGALSYLETARALAYRDPARGTAKETA